MGMDVPGHGILIGVGSVTPLTCLCSHGLFIRIAGWPLEVWVVVQRGGWTFFGEHENKKKVASRW